MVIIVIEFDSTYINYHHLSLLCDRMTCNDNMVSVFRHGINNDDIGPLAKASFEETPEMFLRAARHAELDPMRGVSANVMCGQEGYFGTGAFQTILNINEMKQQLKDIEDYKVETNLNEYIDNEFEFEDGIEECSVNNIKVSNNVLELDDINTGYVDDYYDYF